MEDDKSILNKIIQSKLSKDAYNYNASDILPLIFNNLTDKEKEILIRRFGLEGGEKQTLEEIGQKHNITRERIRQIQSAVIKKIKTLEDLQKQLSGFSNIVKKILSEYGGIMEEGHLLNELLSYSENTTESRQANVFIISQLLDDEIEEVKKTEHLLSGWKLKMLNLEIVHETISILREIIEKENKLHQLEEIISKFKNHKYFTENQEKVLSPFYNQLNGEGTADERIKKLVLSHLNISKNMDKNILNEWGLKNWPTVTPKRMGDKVYLMLKKENRPMHFTEITSAINTEQFDKKIAYPATIHNELILDERFVLVGRGIYALKEWGYEKGTVSDVITEILQKIGHALTKSQIVEEVLKKRIVKKSTIYLALTNKIKFKKTGDSYILAEK